MTKKLLDGSKMSAKKFYEKFEKIVGIPNGEWEKQPTTKFDGTGETWEYRDDNYVLGGSAYSAPILFEIEKIKNR